jgi:hypothetical protein
MVPLPWKKRAGWGVGGSFANVGWKDDVHKGWKVLNVGVQSWVCL